MQETLQSVVDGCGGLPARVVVTTGPRVDPASLRVPSGVEVHRYVPHAELMPRASVVVGHGGHGTTMQALAHDLPVLVLPMDPKTDQPLVGRSLERAGAGRVLPRSADAAAIGEAVRALLFDGPHRAAAARLGAQVRSAAGASGAADAVEAALPEQLRLWRT
jgi:UDP:flavonoid glycosyltransferase YjiC (YdhE family)